MLKLLVLIIIVVGTLLLGLLFVSKIFFAMLRIQKWDKPLAWLLFNMLKSRRRW